MISFLLKKRLLKIDNTGELFVQNPCHSKMKERIMMTWSVGLHAAQALWAYQKNGGDLVSTWVAKRSRAYRGPGYLVNPSGNAIVANDESYSLAA